MDVFVKKGERTDLHCVASPSNGLIYQWYKAISSNLTVGELKFEIFSGENMSELTFGEVQFSNKGVYRCNASNSQGRVMSHPATVTGKFMSSK